MNEQSKNSWQVHLMWLAKDAEFVL